MHWNNSQSQIESKLISRIRTGFQLTERTIWKLDLCPEKVELWRNHAIGTCIRTNNFLYIMRMNQCASSSVNSFWQVLLWTGEGCSQVMLKKTGKEERFHHEPIVGLRKCCQWWMFSFKISNGDGMHHLRWSKCKQTALIWVIQDWSWNEIQSVFHITWFQIHQEFDLTFNIASDRGCTRTICFCFSSFRCFHLVIVFYWRKSTDDNQDLTCMLQDWLWECWKVDGTIDKSMATDCPSVWMQRTKKGSWLR